MKNMINSPLFRQTVLFSELDFFLLPLHTHITKLLTLPSPVAFVVHTPTQAAARWTT